MSERSAATVSTRTLDFCAIADFAAASVSALRDTMITLQPSAAKISAVARPLPLDPPVISAVFPARFRPGRAPGVTPRLRGAAAGAATAYAGMSASRLDHAANA